MKPMLAVGAREIAFCGQLASDDADCNFMGGTYKQLFGS